MRTDAVIREASPQDYEPALALLAGAKLPTADIPDLSGFLVADIDGGIAGLAGLEACGPAGLMRSVVVDPAFRGAQVGRQLVAAVEARARTLGIADLWLLTIDADAWFATLGYRARDRQDAPATIAGTAEFTSLCPADCALMSKRL